MRERSAYPRVRIVPIVSVVPIVPETGLTTTGTVGTIGTPNLLFRIPSICSQQDPNAPAAATTPRDMGAFWWHRCQSVTRRSGSDHAAARRPAPGTDRGRPLGHRVQHKLLFRRGHATH